VSEDQDAVVQAKARRALALLAVLMLVGMGLPFVLLYWFGR
jgi:hypothetical protein